jgi:hypothetical protein
LTYIPFLKIFLKKEGAQGGLLWYIRQIREENSPGMPIKADLDIT